jgi:carboxyl-terminal processing protease
MTEMWIMVKRARTGTVVLLFAATVLVPARAMAQATSFRGLVDEAWHAIDTTYYDTTFHGLDWSAVRRESLARRYPTAVDAYAGIRQMLAGLGDRATRFLTPSQAQALVAEFSGQATEGIGVFEVLSVDVNEQTGAIVVVTPVPGWPAARAGLHPGDIIQAVDGASARELGLAEVMSRLRGPAGTTVALRIRRRDRTLDIRVPRERLPALDPIHSFVREQQGTKIGYIGLRQFTPSAPQQLDTLIDRLQADRVAGYVLDLRNNPGGFVPAVEQIAAMFLGDVPIARVMGRAPDPQVLRAQGARRIEGPMVVLVNGGSASAAEVLAGAVQDQGRAPIVGAHTFGKGLVHGLQTLSDGSAVMPTLGRLETIGGRDVLDDGIAPDVAVSTATSPVIDESVEVASSDDVQYRRAVEILIGLLREH